MILGSEVVIPVGTELDCSVEKELDGISLSCEVLGNVVEPVIVLLASVELSPTVEDVTSVPLVAELNGPLVDRDDSVLSWLLKLEASTVLVENPDPVGAELVSSLLLVAKVLAEVTLSRLLVWDPVKDGEASEPLVEVGSGL